MTSAKGVIIVTIVCLLLFILICGMLVLGRGKHKTEPSKAFRQPMNIDAFKWAVFSPRPFFLKQE